MEATVERFLDESLIAEFKDTPLHTMEEVLAERKDAEERRQRLATRADELMQQELAKQRHEKDVLGLQEAIAERAAEDSAASRAKHAPTSAKGGAPAPAASSSQKLVGAGRSKQLKPYVYNHTEFVTSADANRHARNLKGENELLRRCLQDPRKPGAFEEYLRTATTL